MLAWRTGGRLRVSTLGVIIRPKFPGRCARTKAWRPEAGGWLRCTGIRKNRSWKGGHRDFDQEIAATNAPACILRFSRTTNCSHLAIPRHNINVGDTGWGTLASLFALQQGNGSCNWFSDAQSLLALPRAQDFLARFGLVGCRAAGFSQSSTALRKARCPQLPPALTIIHRRNLPITFTQKPPPTTNRRSRFSSRCTLSHIFLRCLHHFFGLIFALVRLFLSPAVRDLRDTLQSSSFPTRHHPRPLLFVHSFAPSLYPYLFLIS